MLPKISILIPTFNEEDFIEDCVKSLICDSYPIEQIEVLIIDGGSHDKTIEIVQALQVHFSRIKLLRNINKTVPAAMNLGLKEASNPILVWCGSHAKYNKDYLKHSVNTLLSEPYCASAGGVITPIAKTRMGKSIAIATSHKFGIGNAQYRYATESAVVDTVFGGCFYKASADAIGGFNEEWTRNQDYEFNYRLRSEVGNIILNPNIRCQYYCRESIPKLVKQYYSYGYWRFRTLLEHPKSLTLRQTAPILLVTGLILSTIAILSGFLVGLLIPLIYVTATIIISLMVSFTHKNSRLMATLPIIFASIHLSWGCGFMINAIKTSYTRLFRNSN